MKKLIVHILLLFGASAVLCSCAHKEEPAPQPAAVRHEATRASVSITQTPSGEPCVRAEVRSESVTTQQTQSPDPVPTPPESLPKPQGNAEDTNKFL